MREEEIEAVEYLLSMAKRISLDYETTVLVDPARVQEADEQRRCFSVVEALCRREREHGQCKTA